MGRGWRRAFCTSVQGDPEPLTTKEEEQQQRSRTVKLGAIFSSNSNSNSSNSSSTSSTPRGLKVLVPNSPKTLPLHCKTTPTPMPLSMNNAVNNNNNNNKNQSCIGNKESSPSPRLIFQSSSSPSGTRSPSRFALFKTAFRLSKSRCGLCAGSVKSGGDDRTAVFTAECSHVFHFPCISNHVRTQACLVCPVCSVTWQQVPLLSSALPHKSSSSSSSTSSSHDDIALEDRRGRHQGGGTAACKVYNDDESLQSSPTCGGSPCGTQMQFNPIPEEDDRDIDEDCQEGDEDGKQLENKQEGDSDGDDDDVRIRFVPEAMALLSTERGHQSYVVAIKIKAPSIPPRAAMAACNNNKNSKKNRAAAAPPMALPATLLEPACRAPIDLVTVLDASGSMTPLKLQMLKRAMRLVISSLGPGDRLSIVAFSAVAAKRLLPLRRMSRQGQRSARQIVDRLVGCGGSQNQNQKQSSSNSSSSLRMGDALRKATKVLEDRRERNTVATIMLLSDGHAQQQQAPQDQRQQQTHSSSSPVTATRFAHLEIPIHASTSPFIQQKQSRNMSSVQVDQNDDAFAKCVNGLVSVVLQDVHLKFAFSSGYISSVFSFPTADGLGTGQDAIVHGEGGRSVRLGDLYADEERQLLVELRVPKAAIVSHHSASALSMSVSCSYRDPVTRNLIECGERPLSLMPMLLPYQSQSHHPTLLRSSSSSSSSSSFSAMTTAATTQAEQQLLRNLFVTTRAMAESRRLVGLNHLDTAIHLLSSARSLILQQSKNIASHKKFLVCLETELTELQRQQLKRHQQQHQQQQSLSPSQRRRSEQAVLLAEARSGSGSGEEPLTPTSAWRAAEQLAKVAIMRKSLNRVSDLHGLENARF